MRDYALEAESLPEEELRRKYAEICEAYDKMSDDLLYLHNKVKSLESALHESTDETEAECGKRR